MANKIFGYIRVSTPEQNIERQKYDLSKFVKNEANIFIDKQSGRDFNRPAYKELKVQVRDGDDLYVHSIDRLVGMEFRYIFWISRKHCSSQKTTNSVKSSKWQQTS